MSSSAVRADAVVLAGGRSSRFGSDKASALLLGRPLLQWVVSALEEACDRIVIVRAAGQRLPELASSAELVVVDDISPGKGPAAGMVAGFAAVRTELCFVTSCDVPLLRPELVRTLVLAAGAHDVVCPLVEGFHQPLAAVYRVASCQRLFRYRVQTERLPIVPAFGELDTLVVGEELIRKVDVDLRSFRNANRPERLAEIADLLAADRR